uniref:Odorant receptor n=1 Tax=Grapholita molesta TaxID=192188 RepID=A0A9Y1IRX8_GRAMO|nr:odorant-receptor-7 [Grapholita molesta]
MATQKAIRGPATTDALHLDYIRVIRFYLNTIAHWPNEALGPRTLKTRMLTVYHAVMMVTCTCSQTSALFFVRDKMKDHDFIDLGQDYLSILITFVILTRLTLILSEKYRLLIKKFVKKFNLVMHEHVSEYAAKETAWINKICRIATTVIIIECLSGPLLFNSAPLYINYQAGMFSDHRPANKTFLHSVNYYFVLDQYHDTVGYFVVFVLNIFISHICGATFCGLDLLIYIMVFHILGHFNILVDKMRKFPRPLQDAEGTTELSEKQYNEEAANYLKELIEHDQLIKEFMGDTSEAFSITLCFCLMYHQVSGCITLLAVSPMTAEALSRYGVLAFIMYNQLIQMSVIFELIASKSDTIPNEVYGLPWELMDVNNRKTVLTFLMNVQPPKGLKAGGLVSVGVLTMSGIIKNSLSYFLMLKTLGKD